VDFDTESKRVINAENVENIKTLLRLREWASRSNVEGRIIAIEYPRSNYRPVSNKFVDMCLWVGRFQEAVEKVRPSALRLVPYADIARHLTGNSSAKETFVRETLKNRFGEMGLKRAPGPMYIMRNLGEHVWSAFAVCVTVGDTL
jgi:hypothetical protein